MNIAEMEASQSQTTKNELMKTVQNPERARFTQPTYEVQNRVENALGNINSN